MKLLLIDAGNTTCDIRYYNDETKEITPLIRPLTEEVRGQSGSGFKRTIDEALLSHNLTSTIRNDLKTKGFDALLYVSVVPPINDRIEQLGVAYQLPVYNLRNDLPVESDDFILDNLSELGADFIANYYGYRAHYRSENSAIVSLGTATTLFFTQKGRFVGTTITPGLRSSLDALLNRASLLRKYEYQSSNSVMGTNTQEAINVGAINGHYYLILGLINAVKERYPIDEILFTGGNSRYYTQFCANSGITINESLIFRGLVDRYFNKIGRAP